MDFDEFSRKREEERDWQFANGYENGDPETNGEYKCLDLLAGHFGVFVDVGANRGIFSERVKSMAGACRVVAFEPTPHLQDAVRANIDIASGDILHQCALSDHIGESTFHVLDHSDTSSSLTERSEMNPSFTKDTRKLTVQTEVLDSFRGEILGNPASDRPGVFIKIDVEGHEAAVLQGAREIFQSDEPLFGMFEYSFGWLEAGYQFRDAFHYLNDNGFDIYRVTPLGLELIPFYRRAMDDTRYCNYLIAKNFSLADEFGSNIIASIYGETAFVPFPKSGAIEKSGSIERAVR